MKSAWIRGLIQPLQHKLGTITQSFEEGLSKRISFDQVQKLVTQEEEVIEEVSKVQQMVKEFQDKFGPVAQPAPET